MAFHSKDARILGKQNSVQELVIQANDSLLSVSGSDLVVDLGETIASVMWCSKQVAAGTITGIAATASGSVITITGESAAASTTKYIIKYVIQE